MALNGGPLKVARLGVAGVPNNWFETIDDPYYDYRCALPCEVVFDIDDKEWHIVREKVILLSAVLNEMEVDRWLGLSGRKGAHIHCFLQGAATGMVPDRAGFALDIFRLIEEKYGAQVETDPVGYNKGTQQFREFGTKVTYENQVRRKTLWTRPAHELPDTRQQAYRVAGVTIPSTLPSLHATHRDYTKMVYEVTGRRCDPECKSICDNCPLEW